MDWKELLNTEVETTFAVTERLMAKVDPSALGWKPADENNWMTNGQLLRHLGEACGMPMRGFVTGDWGMPEGVDLNDIPADEMLLPAEKMSTVESVAEAQKLLAEDKAKALAMIEQCLEEQLATQPAPAPWDPRPLPLGLRLLQMVEHLQEHKAQLFFYLKLQGLPVNTGDLWGA